MTTLIMIDGGDDEPLSTAINRRLRSAIAGLDLSETAAAERCGRKQQWFSRRLTGATDWGVGELEQVCQGLGLSFTYITTGIRELPTPPPHPPAHPFRAPQATGTPIRRLRSVDIHEAEPMPFALVDDGEPINDDAAAWLHLGDPANNPACPHQGSNLGPADYKTAA